MTQQALTVSKLNAYVSAVLSRDPYLRDLCVKGEVSGYKRHTSGHLYFVIKDEAASIRCVMFKQAALQLRFEPKDGMQVLINGYAALYARDGQFQLYVQQMREDGEGDLYRKFLLYKDQLEAKGYFNEARKKPLPYLPRCVGLVTSKTGAAVQDMLQVIGRRFPGMEVALYHVLVQGEGAADSIAAGIDAANRENRADVLIVGRGGGSMEDLWAFNEPQVAEAIFHSAIPIISAVGHETDITIADFVADLRAPTPSAAAELSVPEYDGLAQWLDTLKNRLEHARAQGVQRKRECLQALLRAAGVTAVRHELQARRQWLNTQLQQAHQAAAGMLLQARQQTAMCVGKLDVLGPNAVIGRGFAVIKAQNGALLTSAASMHAGDSVTIAMRDGQAGAVIEQVIVQDGR